MAMKIVNMEFKVGVKVKRVVKHGKNDTKWQEIVKNFRTIPKWYINGTKL